MHVTRTHRRHTHALGGIAELELDANTITISLNSMFGRTVYGSETHGDHTLYRRDTHKSTVESQQRETEQSVGEGNGGECVDVKHVCSRR